MIGNGNFRCEKTGVFRCANFGDHFDAASDGASSFTKRINEPPEILLESS